MLGRLTYKSSMGDYGCSADFDNEFDMKCAIMNRLGKYEDLGYSPEELKALIDIATNEKGVVIK